MTRTPTSQAYYWDEPEGFDPTAFAAGLTFNPDLVVAPEDLPRFPEPGEKIAVRREVTLRLDAATDRRMEAIAQARGISVADLLEEWTVLEMARIDALEARQHQTRVHDSHAA